MTNESTALETRSEEAGRDSEALLERIDQLERRIVALEEAAKNNAPAMQAAWMHVPIGGSAL